MSKTFAKITVSPDIHSSLKGLHLTLLAEVLFLRCFPHYIYGQRHCLKFVSWMWGFKSSFLLHFSTRRSNACVQEWEYVLQNMHRTLLLRTERSVNTLLALFEGSILRWICWWSATTSSLNELARTVHTKASYLIICMSSVSWPFTCILLSAENWSPFFIGWFVHLPCSP